MKELLRSNRWKLLAASLVILLPGAVGSVWGRGAAAAQALLLLAAQWALVLIVFYANRDREQSPKALGLVVWVLPALSLLLGAMGLLLEGGAGDGYTVMALTTLFMGLLFAAIGNYMPKMRQNGAMGIRVKWTLENEQNWNATHRWAGKLWVAGGLALMACALVPSALVMAVLWVLILGVLAGLPTWYSYRFYRAQLAAGEVEPSPVKPRNVALVCLLAVAFAAFLGWAMLVGDMEVAFGEDSFTVDAQGWGDLTLAYADVQSVAYWGQDPSEGVGGVRTNGLANGKVAFGRFRNGRFGDYTRYTFQSCGACVVLETTSGTVVLNGRDPEATQALYQALLSHIPSPGEGA